MHKTANQIADCVITKIGEEKFRPSVLESVGVPLAGITAASAVGAPSIRAIENLMKAHGSTVGKASYSPVIEKIKKHNPGMQIPKRIIAGPTAGYNLKTQDIWLPEKKTSYETIAHELGHGQSRWAHPAKLLLMKLQKAAPVAALAASGVGALTNSEELVGAAPYIGLGMATPGLLEEINASVRGHRMLRRTGIKPSLGRMYGGNITHMIASLLPAVVAPAIVSKILTRNSQD